MKLDDNDHCQVLCTGEAGAGKSTLSRRLASLWARGELSTPFWGRIKTVIYVTPTDEENNLTQTMRNAIPGKKVYKDVTMDLYTDEPKSVLVIVEGFNEFQNPIVSEEITDLLRDQATNVFLTIRNDSVSLTSNFRNFFTGTIEINGFSDVESENYTQKLLKELQDNVKVPELFPNKDSVVNAEDFLKAIKNMPKIWNSPLNLSLACLLYLEGNVNLSEVIELTEVSLYAMREHKLVEREILRQGQVDPKSIAQIELNKIHKLAVHLLVTQNTNCSEHDLKFFKIDLNSPVLVLLNKEERFSTKDGLLTSWTWPHPQLHEFDAAMGLASIEGFKDSQWMYWIASRPSLNPVAKLVAAILGNDNRHEDVKALTTVTMLSQTNTECLNGACDSKQTQTHQCGWINNYKENSYSWKSWFSDGEFVIQHWNIQLPDLSLLRECRGSLFHQNVSLFKHVQKCWKLGKLPEKEMDFVDSLKDLLLPTIDR